MDVERLNVNDRGRPVSGLSGGEALIRDLESRLGSALPPAYVDFLRHANGGHPEIGCFRPLDSVVENIFDVDRFYSLGGSATDSIDRALRDWQRVLGTNALPIGRDGGGNQLYIDITDGSVWLFLHDESNRRLRVADSFD